MTTQWRPGKRVAIIGGGPGAISAGAGVPQSRLRPEAYGSYTRTHFKNKAGTDRVILPFNAEVERLMGIKGWHYRVLRSSAFSKMLELVAEGTIYTAHEFVSYTEHEDGVTAHFANGTTVEADILVGADGVRSAVSRQLFGDPKLFHTGIRLWLAWCDHIDDIPPSYGYVSHDWRYQASFFPMLHDGKPGFEWWVVEPSWEGKPVPDDIKAHLVSILDGWADPMPRFPEATNFDTQVYRWEIYNRPSLQKWSRGRVVCLGDADGYYLAKFLDGVDLADTRAVAAGFEMYEAQRVDYVNHNVEFARTLGTLFHWLPWPLAKLRDLVFDWTPFLANFLSRGYLEKAEKETLGLSELHVEA